jgi:hypothetical protein
VNGESIIMSISENDALWNNSTKQELEIRNTNTAIIKYKNETSYYISKEIGLALLVLILVFVLISFKKVVGPLLNQTARRKAHPRNKIRTLFYLMPSNR